MTLPVTLKGGLDLRRAKAIVEPGRLIDCQNYEATTDVQGYKPMDGFERYNAMISPSSLDIWQLRVPTASITGSFGTGENLTWTLGSESGDLGLVAVYATSGSDKLITFAYWLATDYMPDGATVTGDTYGGTFTYDEAIHTLQHVTEYTADAAAMFTELGVFSNQNRSSYSAVPGSGPILGMKRFEGDTYAVRNYYNFGFEYGGTVEPVLYQRLRNSLAIEGIIVGIELTSGEWGLSSAAGNITIDALENAFYTGAFEDFQLLGEYVFTSGSEEPAIGATLQGATSTSQVDVHRIRLDSGTWAGGDAAGVIFFYNSTGDLTDGEAIDNLFTTTANVMTNTTQTHKASSANVLASTGEVNSQSKAGLWKSSRTNYWDRIELDWELKYDTGTNEPVVIDLGGALVDLLATTEDTGWLTGLAVGQSAYSTKENFAGLSFSSLSADDGTEATVTMTTYQTSQFAWVYQLPTNLKASDTPLGFEVEFRCLQSTAGSDGRFLCQLRDTPAALGATKWTDLKVDSDYPLNTAVEFTHLVGSTTDDWGGWTDGSTITADDVNAGNFTVQFAIQAKGAAGTPVFNVDQVRVRITYLPAGNKIYFWDGTNERGTGILTQDNIATGAYSTNDAAGTYTISELTRYDFGSGIEIRTAAAGGGALIAMTTAAPSRVSMAGSSLLATENSRYQFMVQNFYAADTLNAMWGVSGAGLAFVYDGSYFRRIRTGVLEMNDKPRHLGAFQFRLILGYAWGEESWSIAGTPLSFDGTLNAVATGYGYPITGILELPGQILGTFTTGGVFGTKVSGADFDQQILAPGSKVIEYSVQQFGNDVLWCDQNGIRNLSSTQKYGDFEAGTLSRDVNKWLRPRLRRNAQSSPRNGNFVNSTIVRSKGQYRLYFADGQALTMAWDQVDEPVFTKQKLWLDNDSTNGYIEVFATSSDLDEDGPEHVYFSIAERDNYSHGSDLKYVFRSDRGTSFDGDAIVGFLTVSWINAGNAVENKRFTKWQLHGEAYNYATPTIDFAVDLVEPDGTGAETLKIGASSNAATVDMKPFFTKPRSKKRGRNIAVRFDHNSSTELPHLLQLLISVDETKGRKEV